MQRLKKLVERGEDTEVVLGSDVMALALEGYGLPKIAGKNQGIEAMRKKLGSRFSKTRAAAKTAAAAAPATA